MKRDYELIVVYDLSAISEEKEDARHAVEAMLKKAGVSVLDVDDWGRKNTAHPIKGNDSAYYILYHIQMDTEKANDVQTRLKHNDDVLRWLLVLHEEEEEATKTEEKEETEE